MNHPNGAWIWVLESIRTDYLNELRNRKVKRIYLKVFDGRSTPMFWGFQCNTNIISAFNSAGIEVYGWGYHYATPDVTGQVSAVQQALSCGLGGYVVDIEAEAEDTNSHINVEQLLKGLRPLVGPGKLGYTSFGHPGFHPNVPWKILDQHCDIAMPQIYFEKFSFGSSNEDEVQACLKAHTSLGLTKPILPIWGSESDASQPASRSELQSLLIRYPGSSIWRIPNRNQQGQAWNLDYASSAQGAAIGAQSLPVLPTLTRILRNGSIGPDVNALQAALNAQGFNAGQVDGEFGSATEAAVRRFQQKADLTIDGEVWSETWKALGGKTQGSMPTKGKRFDLAEFAEDEAAKQLSWSGATSEAEKYLDLFRAPMQALGQIGTQKVFYDWCGAFVYYCCTKIGLSIPVQPAGFWATLALVESWKYWAKKEGYWYRKGDASPQRGDIVVFDWDGDGELNHIGIVRSYTPGSATINTSEGNKQNRSGNYTRSMSTVAGFIRITDA